MSETQGGQPPITYRETPHSSSGTTDGADTPSQATLKGHLGVVSIVFTVLAFNAPIAVAAGFIPLVIGFGNQTGAPSAFVVTGCILLLFSVGMIAMSRFMHSPGAFYSYIVAGLGRVPGLGGAFAAIAAYSAFGITMTIYGGIVAQDLVAETFHGPSLPWWLWGLVLWAAATFLSLRRIELSAKVLGVALVLEIGLVAVYATRVFWSGGQEGISLEPFTPAAFFSGSLSVGLLYAVLCVTGFEAVAVFRQETKDPVKTIPRATYTSVIFMCAFYALVAWAYLSAFGSQAAVDAASTDPSGSFTASVGTYLGVFAQDLVSVLLVTSSFACLLATMNIGSRYLYTLGSDEVLPKTLGTVHPKHRSPYTASLVFAAIPLLGTLIPSIAGMDPLTTYAATSAIGAFCLLLLYAATSLAVIFFFRRHRNHTANLWQSTIAPILAFASLLTVIILAIIHLPDIMGGTRTAADITLAIIAVIIGLGSGLAVVYRRAKPAVYARIGRQDV